MLPFYFSKAPGAKNTFVKGNYDDKSITTINDNRGALNQTMTNNIGGMKVEGMSGTGVGGNYSLSNLLH